MHFIGLLATTRSLVVGGSINENADGCILSTGSELITVNNVAISASGPRHQPPSGNQSLEPGLGLTSLLSNQRPSTGPSANHIAAMRIVARDCQEVFLLPK